MEWYYIDESGKPVVAPEVLAHPVFSCVNDMYGEKGLLIIWYLSSPLRNPYWNAFENDRKDKLAEEFIPYENTEEKLFPQIIENASKLLADMFSSISPAYVTVYKARYTAERALTFLQTVDYSKETKTGHMKYKPADVSKAIRELTQDIDSLNRLLVNMQEELKPQAIGRKGRLVSQFENPNVNLKRKQLE